MTDMWLFYIWQSEWTVLKKKKREYSNYFDANGVWTERKITTLLPAKHNEDIRREYIDSSFSYHLVKIEYTNTTTVKSNAILVL